MLQNWDSPSPLLTPAFHLPLYVHQHFGPLGHEHVFDHARGGRVVVDQVHRVKVYRVAVAGVVGARQSDTSAPVVGVGLVELDLAVGG